MAKYCPNCGNEINGASYCSNCGARLNGTSNSSYGNSKSKIAAGILGLFLGGLGIHNFYLGYSGKGTAQLLLSLLSCGTLSWVSAIWGFVEGILILVGNINVDGNGNPLSD